MPTTIADYSGPIKPEPAVLQLGDPIAHELVRLYPFDLGEDLVGATDFEDIVNGSDMTLVASDTFEWGIDETGRIVQYDGVGSDQLAYAGSTDPAFLTVEGQNFSFLWAGVIDSGAAATLQALLALGSTLTATHYAALEYNNLFSANNIRWVISKVNSQTVLSANPPQDRRIVCIGVHDVDANEMRLYVDGQRTTGTPATYAADSDLNRLHLNARQAPLGVSDEGVQSCSILAVWLRALTDNEALRLTYNPMLLIEREPQDDLVCQPYYRQLTQPSFPVISTSKRAVDHTDPRTAGVLIAAKANRINERELSLRLASLNPDERSLLVDLYDNGRGLVEPFWVNIPNESARRMIIKTPVLEIADRTAVNAEATIELIDVTNPLDILG